jgi:hypothetical protein
MEKAADEIERLRAALEKIEHKTRTPASRASVINDIARDALTGDAVRLPGESQEHANERIAWERHGALSCEHDWKYVGHGHNYSEYQCVKCFETKET